MGAGKTTTGQLVAGGSAGCYRDSDADVEAAHRAHRARVLRPRRRGGLPARPKRRSSPRAVRRSEALGDLRRRRGRAQPGEPRPDRPERHRRLAAGPARDARRPGGGRRAAARCSTTTRPTPWCGSTKCGPRSTRRCRSSASTWRARRQKRWPTASSPPRDDAATRPRGRTSRLAPRRRAPRPRA